MENPFACVIDGNESNGVFAASLFLAPVVWEAIGEVVVAARDAMGWLKKALRWPARAAPVNWMTPDRFPVQQAYFATEVVQVRLKMAGTACKLKIRRRTTRSTGVVRHQEVSPSFVHSCDGTALRQYVVRPRRSPKLTHFCLRDVTHRVRRRVVV